MLPPLHVVDPMAGVLEKQEWFRQRFSPRLLKNLHPQADRANVQNANMLIAKIQQVGTQRNQYW